jgi:hypothetical protein
MGLELRFCEMYRSTFMLTVFSSVNRSSTVDLADQARIPPNITASRKQLAGIRKNYSPLSRAIFFLNKI